MESLNTVWVSRANALLMRGRAGRVMEGFCFHLYVHFRYDNHMRKDPVPEIQRVPLEKMVLRIQILQAFQNLSVFFHYKTCINICVKKQLLRNRCYEHSHWSMCAFWTFEHFVINSIIYNVLAYICTYIFHLTCSLQFKKRISVAYLEPEP